MLRWWPTVHSDPQGPVRPVRASSGTDISSDRPAFPVFGARPGTKWQLDRLDAQESIAHKLFMTLAITAQRRIYRSAIGWPQTCTSPELTCEGG